MTLAEIIGPVIGIIVMALFVVGYQRIDTLLKNHSRAMRAPCPGCGAKGIRGELCGNVFSFLCSACGHRWSDPV
jgi:predicted RNA-binding Zn-ribbon protein involved in translation (DUF1610 family)